MFRCHTRNVICWEYNKVHHQHHNTKDVELSLPFMESSNNADVDALTKRIDAYMIDHTITLDDKSPEELLDIKDIISTLEGEKLCI